MTSFTINESKSEQAIERFRRIQAASKLLYESLGRACLVHTEHMAQLCSEVTCLETGEVQFGLAMCPESTPPRASRDSSVVSQMCEGILDTSPIPTKEGDQFQWRCDPLVSRASRLAEKDLTTRCCRDLPLNCKPTKHIQKQATPRVLTVSAQERQSDEGLFKRTVRRDMSEGVEDLLSERSCIPIDCPNAPKPYASPINIHIYQLPYIEFQIGFSKKGNCCTHDARVSKNPARISLSQQPISLQQLITRETSQSTADFPQFQKLRLGGLLTRAVLQFHKTPWLADTWHDEDIRFFDIDHPRKHLDKIPSLHVNARLFAMEAMTQTSGESASSRVQHSLTPNPALFRLGVALLEIAYGASIESLRLPIDDEASTDARHVEYFVAHRLADEVGSTLGAKFAPLVRKCLV